MSKIVKPLGLAIGAAFIGSLTLAQVAAANGSQGFELNSLKSGYMVGDAKEGKCGEGKCGANKGKKCSDIADKAAAEKCMADAHKGKEGSCSADKKGKEGSCSADKKGKEGSCSADKKGKEGSCSGDKKGKEGSCNH